MKLASNPRVSRYIALFATVLFPAIAWATPQESVTFLAVNSQGTFNAANNIVLTNSFTGGYAVKSIHVTAARFSLRNATAQNVGNLPA